MIENRFGDNIDIYQSAGRLLDNPDKPDGTDLESNKDIYFDYIMPGYDSRTPWNPVGIEDHIAITEGQTILEQEQTLMYEARFYDEDPPGDKITGYWHWKLVAFHSGGEVIIDSCNTSGEYTTTAFLNVADLDTMSYDWVRNEYNSIVGKIRLSATDNSGTPHGTTLDIEIIEDIETPTIAECYGHTESVTLSFTAFGAQNCEIYYDIDSGPPYNGDNADQGPSPIYFQGDSGKITLTGLTNGTTYYFAIKANNYYEQTDYSEERYATPITTSGTLTHNETWPGLGNPDTVVVTEDIAVPSGINLTIEPGTSVLFDPGVSLKIFGYLSASGNWNERIVFDGTNPGSYWGGIYFEEGCDESSTILRCDISHANHGIYLDRAAPQIRYYNNISNCVYGIFSRYCAPDGFENCDFDFNVFAGIYLQHVNSVANWHVPILDNNFGSNLNGVFLYNSDALIWDHNYFFNNNAYGINANNECDVQMIDGDDHMNTMEDSHDGEIYLSDFSDALIGHFWYYNQYGATNRILGDQYRVVAYDHSFAGARRVWWGVYWEGMEPPGGLFIEDGSSTIDHYFPLEYDPLPTMLALNAEKTGSDTKNVFAETVSTTGADSLDPIEQAILYIFEKKYDLAESICDSIITTSPDSKKAIHAQSLLWRVARRTSKSDFQDFLSGQVQKYSDQELGVAAQRTQALITSGNGDYKTAISMLEQINNNPKFKGTTTHRNVLFDLIDMYHFDVKDDGVANKYFDELAKCFPKDDLVAVAKLFLNPVPGNFSQPPIQIAGKSLTQIQITPTEFALHQNFPNPFNSTTTIQYQLPEACPVTLAIYNMLGQKIKTLVNNEHRTAGVHQVSWDGRDDLGRSVSSGVFVYRLTAGSFVDSRKLVVMM